MDGLTDQLTSVVILNVRLLRERVWVWGVVDEEKGQIDGVVCFDSYAGSGLVFVDRKNDPPPQ